MYDMPFINQTILLQLLFIKIEQLKIIKGYLF